MATWLPIARQAARRLRRAPLFTAAAVVTLAAGIGANTAIFTVVNTVRLKPLPFEDAERLVGVWQTAPGLGFADVNQGPATYLTYREEGRVFEDIGLWDDSFVSVTGRTEPERVSAMRVTDGTLPLLRVRPRLGRVFTPEEDQPGGPETVILSDGFWRRAMGADENVVGQALTIDGRPRTIVGVMPPDLHFLAYDPAVYLPFRFNRAEVRMGNFSYQGVARLKQGVTIAQANADVARMIPMAVQRFPGALTMQMLEQAKFGPNLRPLARDVVGDIGNALWILLGTVGIVLLIACANVANLFLVRTEGMQRDIAVRTALGASRWRVARELLAESVALGVLGGVAGIALAWAGVRLLVAMGPRGLPRLGEMALDPAVLVFAAAISVFAGVLFGLLPVVRYTRPNLGAALKEGGRANSAGRERHIARNVLVIAQVALALVLLVGSGLMVRTFQSLRQVDPGFRDPAQVLTLRIAIPESEVAGAAQVALVHEDILARLSRVQGVTSVGISSSIEMDGSDNNDALEVEDFPVPAGQIPPIRRLKQVSPGYFGTMGNPVVAGRALEWEDVHGRRPVAVVTANFAREYWKEPAAALGRRIRPALDGSSPWREIVGVVGDVHDDGVSEDATKVIYWPMVMRDYQGDSVATQANVGYAIRSPRVGTAALMDEVRAAVWSVNPNLPLANVRTLDDLLRLSMARTSFTLVMLAIAAGVALLLGAVGIYGVIAYMVAQRTREIGVRMALGAQGRDVRRLVLNHALALAGSGVAIGLVASAAFARLMTTLLHGVRPFDLVTYSVVSVVLASIVVLASSIPARRATRIDPIEALRWE